jgi:hypothetical protein
MRRLSKIVLPFGFVMFACVVGAPSVHADGDDFFAFQLGTNAGTKNSFIGSVKDDRGNFLSGATLTILVKAPSVDEADDSPIDVTFKSFTNVIGRYRTLSADDMVSVISGAAVVLKPEDVKLVGVTKAGYKQIQRIDRSRPGRSMREIDFVMKKVDN